MNLGGIKWLSLLVLSHDDQGWTKEQLQTETNHSMEWTTLAKCTHLLVSQSNISEVFNQLWRKGKAHSPGTWPPSHSACSQTTKCWMLHSVQQTKPHQQSVVENMTVGRWFFSPVGSWFFMTHVQETPQTWTGHYAKVIIWLHGQVEIWNAKHKWFLMVAL